MKPYSVILSLSLCAISVALLSSPAHAKPLKVFVLCGQSNMQGHAHVRTLDHLAMDPSNAAYLKEIRNEDGSAKLIDDVWISYLSSGGEKHGQLSLGFGADENKISPELAFGVAMKKALGEPFLIIKTAWGGKSINTDFRPPSAGPYVFNEKQLENLKKRDKDLDAIKAEKAKATGHYYKLTVDYVKKTLADIKSVYPNYDTKQGYELAGFVWFQGWNDMVDGSTYPQRGDAGGYDAYSEVLAHFIRDMRKDLEAPQMPFVIGVLGAGGPVAKYGPDQQRYRGIHQNFRDAMAAPASLPEFKGNVTTVLTENYWDHELTELKTRERKIRSEIQRQQKDGKLSKEEAKKAIEEQRSEAFTEKELATLEKGISNQEYHYLGASTIMTGIGTGFAEALTKK